MRILITGGTGQLGSECAKVLNLKHVVIALSSRQLDITNSVAVKDIICRVNPDIILNCAAYTKVDGCETEKKLSWNVNVNGPRLLANNVHMYGGKLVHISTDYVFDGSKRPPEPYLEGDKPAPLSFYGQTKLASELAIREVTDRHIIVRTA